LKFSFTGILLILFQVAELLQTIRSDLVALLKEKIEDPSLNLLTHKKGSLIISTIKQVVAEE
jgi:hypothetical protein